MVVTCKSLASTFTITCNRLYIHITAYNNELSEKNNHEYNLWKRTNFVLLGIAMMGSCLDEIVCEIFLIGLSTSKVN